MCYKMNIYSNVFLSASTPLEAVPEDSEDPQVDSEEHPEEDTLWLPPEELEDMEDP